MDGLARYRHKGRPSDLSPLSPTGGLSLAVEGPSKAEITCKDNKDGTCTVSYLPTAPGDYSIIVRFDDKHIPGSPFTAKITGEVDTPGRTTCHTRAQVRSLGPFGQRLLGRGINIRRCSPQQARNIHHPML